LGFFLPEDFSVPAYSPEPLIPLDAVLVLSFRAGVKQLRPEQRPGNGAERLSEANGTLEGRRPGTHTDLVMRSASPKLLTKSAAIHGGTCKTLFLSYNCFINNT
jgi:hypothetical protein